MLLPRRLTQQLSRQLERVVNDAVARRAPAAPTPSTSTPMQRTASDERELSRLQTLIDRQRDFTSAQDKAIRDLTDKVDALTRSPKPASTPTVAVPPSPAASAPTGPSAGHNECNFKLDELWRHAKSRIKLVDERVDELKNALTGVAVANLGPSAAASKASGPVVDALQRDVAALRSELATLSTNVFASTNRLMSMEDAVGALKSRLADLEKAADGEGGAVGSSSSSSEAGDGGDAVMGASDSDDDDKPAPEPGEVMQE